MNIYLKEDQIATENLTPGKRVYGEQLLEERATTTDNLNSTLTEFENKVVEYRIWNPRRSKLAAAFLNGLNKLKIANDSKILYLGASTGTTVSHISDIAKDGLIYAIEFSSVSMRKLNRLSENRPNIAPLLADVTKPKEYINLIEKVDFIYCDVAQPNQTDAFIKNIKLFLKENSLAMIMIKSRSINVSQKPQKIFKQEEKKLIEKGFAVIEKIKLEPYEKDHICFLVKEKFK
ncbi:MAG: fibrillarin-like rRNA/tRNA 2'-O-methyltransferase [Methanobacteriaceae archaeon]|jgi:fibrillarin-like pre-rRNA processing protein|nr:fibrillarin-like rRNA/tRNA 2'-O-methyltransferase [Candidatus Methanorudis spinitermitis]